MVQKEKTANLSYTTTRDDIFIELDHPIEVIDATLSNQTAAQVQVILHADETLVETDITDDTIIDHDKEKIVLTVAGVNITNKTQKLVVYDKLRIASIGSGNGNCMIEVDYIDRFDLIDFDEFQKHMENRRNVDRQRSAGNEYFRVGDKRKVNQ